MNKLMIVILLFALFSCSKEEKGYDEIANKSNVNSTIVAPVYECKDKDLVLVAKSVLRMINSNNNVSELVERKCNERFDGDYNVLLSSIVKEKIPTRTKSSAHTTFGGMLNSYLVKRKSRNSNVTNSLEEVMSKYPLLQIATPMADMESNRKSIDLNKETLVAVLGDDYNEKQDFITAYDERGESHLLNNREQPNQRVVVISRNERNWVELKESVDKRCEELGLSVNDLIASSQLSLINDHTYAVRGDLHFRLYNVRQTTPMPSINTKPKIAKKPVLYDRDKNDFQDVLYKARFVSKGAIREVEPWAKGHPEVYLKVIIKGEDEPVTKDYTHWAWLTNNWVGGIKSLKTYEFNTPIVNWDPVKHGDVMKYVWYESDGGGSAKTVEQTIVSAMDPSITTTISYTIPKDDEDLGSALVFYKDKDASIYSTGAIEFSIKLKELRSSLSE